MSEIEQEQPEEMEPVPMGEAASPEDADLCVIGNGVKSFCTVLVVSSLQNECSSHFLVPLTF
jgi:hypothetical protein